MPESRLAEQLGEEQATAVRVLLAHPLLDSGSRPEDFRLVVRHEGWLRDHFETTCGWVLHVDVASGFARLAKRPADDVDTTRPLRRTRGQAAPFDRRRYELLCIVCAELVRHPVTTVGMLAGSVTAEAGLDTSRHGERLALVDALRALLGWGAVTATAGDVESFVDDERGNAIVSADTARLHRLLACATAASAIDGTASFDESVGRLLDEPRYPTLDELPAGPAGDEARNRWARHHLGRRLLDDPVVHLDDLHEVEVDYLASISGRRWLRDRVVESGLVLEERAEGLLTADTDGVATDIRFPAPLGHAHQLALLLADRLVATGPDGTRALATLTAAQIRAEVHDIFERFPTWARGQRDDGGPERLGREAVDLLASFGLVRTHQDGSVSARPALARYRVSEPTAPPRPPNLFEHAP